MAGLRLKLDNMWPDGALQLVVVHFGIVALSDFFLLWASDTSAPFHWC